MSDAEARSQVCIEDAAHLLEIAELVLSARSVEDVAGALLPMISRLMQSPSAFLYIAASSLMGPQFLHHGLQPEESSHLRNVCPEHFGRFTSTGDAPEFLLVASAPQSPNRHRVYPLRTECETVGLIGLHATEAASSLRAPAQGLLRILAKGVSHIAERMTCDRQLHHLNTYLTVSSMLAQSLGLRELLEIAFAVRNARIFEYVVNSYCRQRQGQTSCKGCKRPLGSWTPCAKYRESAI